MGFNDGRDDDGRPCDPGGHHDFWGSWLTPGDLPNTSTAKFRTTELRRGDRALVKENASGNPEMWICSDPDFDAAQWFRDAELVDNGKNVRAGDVEIRPGYGEIYLTTPVETVIAAASTPAKALGTTALGPGLTAVDFDMPANNRLRWIGSETRVMHVAASFSMTAASNSIVVALYVAKNDVVLPASRVRRKIGTGSDVGTGAMHVAVEMDPNDYLEVWLENEDTGADLTLETLNLFAMGMRIPT